MSNATALALLVFKGIGFGLVAMTIYTFIMGNPNYDLLLFGALMLVYTDVVMIRIEIYREYSDKKRINNGK
jgi:hypothetical protein